MYYSATAGSCPNRSRQFDFKTKSNIQSHTRARRGWARRMPRAPTPWELWDTSAQVVAEAGTGLLFRSPDAGEEKEHWYEPDFELPFPRDAWEPPGLDTATYAPTGETLRRAYAISLICGGLKEREPDWILSGTREWVDQDWTEALFGERARADGGGEAGGGQGDVRPDVADALQCCGERLFVQTHEGYIGLAPANTRVGDVIAVLLGCSTPLVLRSSADRGPGYFTVVGECFVHGLNDAVALLGPLPAPWACVAVWVQGNRRCPRFLNTETGELTREDPRLEALEGWERVERMRVDGDDPTLYDFFREKASGRVVNWDPRLEPERLLEKGMDIEWLDLV